MAKYKCSACEELRKSAPAVIRNGVSNSSCVSLKNNTGLNPSNNIKDCEDLENLNDCFVGNMATELPKYDDCNWKKFMKDFIPNVWNTFKAIICSICGLWCNINFLLNGMRLTFTEEDFIAGSHVSLNRPDTQHDTVDLSCMIKGNLARFHGSVEILMNKTQGPGTPTSITQWGQLGLSNTGNNAPLYGTLPRKINTGGGGYTIAILKLKKSEYPEIKKIYSDNGLLVDSGCGVVRVCGYNEGEKYPGQWGAAESGWKTVPKGYYYVPITLTNLVTWGVTGGDGKARVTFDCLNMVDFDSRKARC